MQIGGWKKVVLGILATILLGALGSGLWDIALKPGGYWFWHGVLTAATFGSKYLKDRVYLEAAKGNHEGVSLVATRILFALWGMITGAVFAILAFILLFRRPVPGSTGKVLARLGGDRFTGIGAVIVVLALLQINAGLFVADLKADVANELYVYFQQSLDICRPYLTEHQEQVFKSRYAGLHTRDEYLGIANDLQQIAGANHLSLPDFKPW